jgi:DNA-directed RNA polymerase subunit RPC12/RpoP
MRCAECGVETGETGYFCTVCGAPAVEQSSAATPIAAWMSSGARILIQGRSSSTVAVGCCGPARSAYGPGGMGADEGAQQEKDCIPVCGGIPGMRSKA